jgi:two-component system nitrate/nitrite response regulator NarL
MCADHELEPAVIRVIAADAQPLSRSALCSAISECAGFELVGQTADGRDALGLLRELRPEVAVLEPALPGLDGHRILRLARVEALPTRIVFVGVTLDPLAAYEMIEYGAAGCLTRAADAEQVCEAISTVAAGDVFLSREIQRAIAREIRLRAGGQRTFLSRREHEVLRRIAAGQTAPVIALETNIAVGTVKTHLSNLYEKLGVSDRAAAVAVGMRRGLLD